MKKPTRTSTDLSKLVIKLDIRSQTFLPEYNNNVISSTSTLRVKQSLLKGKNNFDSFINGCQEKN